MEFSGKTALITGAAGAIGKGVAADLARRGARIFVTDLDPDAVTEAVRELTEDGAVCEGLAANVVEESQVQAVVESAARFFRDSIDILINVAGVVGQGKVEELTVEEWDRVMAVNCKGSFLFVKYVVPYMKKNQYGKIVNFSSKSGKTGSALMSHYCAAKGAIISFTQALAYELASSNINVNCVCPGITEATGVWSNVSSGYVREMDMPMDQIVKKFTSKVPLGRLAKIEDVVAVTNFLASSGADYMTGQAINITGGREMH